MSRRGASAYRDLRDFDSFSPDQPASLPRYDPDYRSELD